MTPRQPIYLTPYAYSLVDGANIGSLVSSADTEIYVSPQKINQSGASNVTFQAFSDGYTAIRAVITGSHYVYVSTDVPARLFGTAFKLKRLEFCYDLENATNFITEVDARYVDGTGVGQVMISDLTDRLSTTWSCVGITDATPALIDGSVIVRFMLIFNNTTNVINIGKIKLILTQQ